MNALEDFDCVLSGVEIAAKAIGDYAITGKRPKFDKIQAVNDALDAVELLHKTHNRVHRENCEVKSANTKLRKENDDLASVKAIAETFERD